MAVGQELLNVPFDEMVLKLALAVAEGQTALDANSVVVAQKLATTSIELPSISDPATTVEFPLIALGFFPKFYEFPESIIEVKMAITMARETEAKATVKAKVGWGPFSASVNASYSSKYSYKVEGSSLLRTRLTPVPPPIVIQKYMEALMEAQLKAAEAAGKELPAGVSVTP